MLYLFFRINFISTEGCSESDQIKMNGEDYLLSFYVFQVKSLCALVQHSFKLFFHANSFYFISILNKTSKVRFLIFSEIISCIYNLQSPYKIDYNMYNRSSCNFLHFLKIHLVQHVIVNTQYSQIVQTWKILEALLIN